MLQKSLLLTKEFMRYFVNTYEPNGEMDPEFKDLFLSMCATGEYFLDGETLSEVDRDNIIGKLFI